MQEYCCHSSTNISSIVGTGHAYILLPSWSLSLVSPEMAGSPLKLIGLCCFVAASLVVWTHLFLSLFEKKKSFPLISPCLARTYLNNAWNLVLQALCLFEMNWIKASAKWINVNVNSIHTEISKGFTSLWINMRVSRYPLRVKDFLKSVLPNDH